MERLQKFLAAAGVSSRRKAEKLILEGRVTVNGEVVSLLGTRIDPERDTVAVDGKRISQESRRTIMLHKPAGYLTTRYDMRDRDTVMQLIPAIPVLHPIGRLDKDTTGLLLLTNDGALTYALTHPRHHVSKTYHARVAGVPDDAAIARLRQGGFVVEGRPVGPAEVRVLKRKKDSALLEISIREGRKRQVRRMCEAVGHPVAALARVRIGPLELGNLPEGQWRELTRQEINALYRAAGEDPEGRE